MNNFKIFIAALIILSITSCKKESSDIIPEGLVEKREFLSQKKTELREMQKSMDALNEKINEVSEQINELDPPKEKPSIPVITQMVVPQDFIRFKEMEAKVVAEDIVNASSDIGGRLLSVAVKEGQYVSKGQLIAVTDMEIVEKQKVELETSLALAQTVFERQKRLWDQNIGSEMQFLQAKNQKEQLEKSLETLGSQMRKKNVYAPISGVVDMKFMSQGEIAAPGMPIVQILNTSKVKIVADLQENLLGSIKKGQLVEISLPAIDLNLKKRVSLIGRSIDAANRTFKIEIDCSSQNGKLKPNLLALVKINDFTQKDALTIPLDIIQEEVTGKKYIYKAVKDGDKKMAKKAYITLGESSDGNIIVSEGLAPNEEIIIKGGLDLGDGNPITTTITEGINE